MPLQKIVIADFPNKMKFARISLTSVLFEKAVDFQSTYRTYRENNQCDLVHI